MSSKLVTGEPAAAASPIHWTRANSRPAAQLEARGAGPDGEAERRAWAAEIERQVREAREAGLREGEAAGLLRAAAQTEPLLERLARTAGELAACRGRFRREAEQDLVRLALSVARRILHRELAVDPAAMLGLAKSALEQLDLRETHRLRLHPQDLHAIQPRLAELGLPPRLEIVPDAALERGAAVFETARGEMDASVDTQLAEISRGLADLLERRA
ncbi:MAG: hypothetical protein HY822_24525 [Acidobacteria bacterium]|nr:hypothetical protein [Acidobacteriota bacterium]